MNQDETRQTPGSAKAALTLGILGLWVVITGIPGIICGHIALRTINSDPTRYKGTGIAITGLVLRAHPKTLVDVIG
jgi:hypothetical protein